jgi:hypothetical protein
MLRQVYPGRRGGGIGKAGRREKDSESHDRVKRHSACGQRMIAWIGNRLIAATVVRGHFHLAALALHYAAAGTLGRGHLRVHSHARHQWRSIGDEQQCQQSELASHSHTRSIPFHQVRQRHGSTPSLT